MLPFVLDLVIFGLFKLRPISTALALKRTCCPCHSLHRPHSVVGIIRLVGLRVTAKPDRVPQESGPKFRVGFQPHRIRGTDRVRRLCTSDWSCYKGLASGSGLHDVLLVLACRPVHCTWHWHRRSRTERALTAADFGALASLRALEGTLKVEGGVATVSVRNIEGNLGHYMSVMLLTLSQSIPMPMSGIGHWTTSTQADGTAFQIPNRNCKRL